MQIHELNSFVGTPSAGDYLAIDDGSETTKVEASNLGVTTQMTQAEAEAGTETESRVVAPSIFKTAVTAIASAISGVFVSMTTPKYTLDTSAASGDDYDLTQALTSLGWLSDVVTSGVLGMKKLLHKILGRFGVTETYVEAQNGITGGIRLFKDNSTNTVRCYGYFRRSTDINTSTAIFTVPSEYRPQGNYTVPMFFYTSTGLCAGFYGILTAQSGAITQSLGNTVREGFISAEWKLTF